MYLNTLASSYQVGISRVSKLSQSGVKGLFACGFPSISFSLLIERWFNNFDQTSGTQLENAYTWTWNISSEALLLLRKSAEITVKRVANFKSTSFFMVTKTTDYQSLNSPDGQGKSLLSYLQLISVVRFLNNRMT